MGCEQSLSGKFNERQDEDNVFREKGAWLRVPGIIIKIGIEKRPAYGVILFSTFFFAHGKNIVAGLRISFIIELVSVCSLFQMCFVPGSEIKWKTKAGTNDRLLFLLLLFFFWAPKLRGRPKREHFYSLFALEAFNPLKPS